TNTEKGLITSMNANKADKTALNTTNSTVATNKSAMDAHIAAQEQAMVTTGKDVVFNGKVKMLRSDGTPYFDLDAVDRLVLSAHPQCNGYYVYSEGNPPKYAEIPFVFGEVTKPDIFYQNGLLKVQCYPKGVDSQAIGKMSWTMLVTVNYNPGVTGSVYYRGLSTVLVSCMCAYDGSLVVRRLTVNVLQGKAGGASGNADLTPVAIWSSTGTTDAALNGGGSYFELRYPAIATLVSAVTVKAYTINVGNV
ncbi:MAG: hypothetical protein ACRC37_01335, partial [Lentisphaeria bacterium]